MTDLRASLLAFLIAPIVPSVALALSSPGLGGGLGSDLVTLTVLSALFYFYALVAVGFLGVPAFLLLRRYNLDSFLSTVGASTILTILVAVALGAHPNGAIAQWMATMAVTAFVGAATGITFWMARWFCLRLGGSNA
jgi:hypothetical protein